MMDFTLIVFAAPVVYLLIGLVYARSQSTRIYAEARKTWSEGSTYFTEEVRRGLALRIVGWPFCLIVEKIGFGIARWIMAPVSTRKEKAAELRADAKHWEREARDEIDPEKKAMAEELARSLKEHAEEVDI